MNHDQMIDLVARQMTEAEPPSDLRARVMAALPTSRPHRWIRIAIPATAIAALGLAAVLTRPAGPSAPAGPLGLSIPSSPSGPATAVAHTTGESLGSVEAVVTRRQQPVHTDDLPLASRIPPLPALTPVFIEPIQPVGLSIAPITVTPIVTEPIALPALDSRAGGRE